MCTKKYFYTKSGTTYEPKLSFTKIDLEVLFQTLFNLEWVDILVHSLDMLKRLQVKSELNKYN